MITSHVERLADCLEELKVHFEAHWRELALNQTQVPLAPNYAAYLEREARGEVLCVTLREGGQVIAYFVGFVTPALHYQTCLTLQMDLFWLHPMFRHTDSLGALEADLVATKLFDRVEQAAKARGVQRAFYGSKLHADASALFERRGMIEVERYWSAWWGA